MFFKKFQRKTENFKCENCRKKVKGNGYTNHCPNCLWSRHVDVNPGDRQADCCGLMEPVGVDAKADEFVLIHRCVKCGHEKKNKASEADNFNEIIKIIERVN